MPGHLEDPHESPRARPEQSRDGRLSKMSATNNPLVSVVVPARNEEACLGSCLESLVAQTGINFEVIVVNDDSSDRTAEIARSFPGVHLIEAGPLLDGWTGKNNAMATGAKAGKAKWLLFTDADTVHKSGSLMRAVAEAEQRGAALLSYSPQQEVRGFWEKAVMPVIFAELAVTYPPAKVNDPASPLAAANGQYLLISREAYDAVGGHANPKIAGDLLEDVAIARLVKRSGRKIFFRYGGDAVRTRMYRSFGQLREGWTKNLALLFRHPVRLAGWSLLEFLCFVALANGLIRGVFFGKPYFPSGSVLAAYHVPDRYAFLFKDWMVVGVAVAVLCLLLNFIRRIRKAHFSWALSGVSLLGPPIFVYLLLRSTYFYKKGRVDWKARSYVYSVEEINLLRSNKLPEQI